MMYDLLDALHLTDDSANSMGILWGGFSVLTGILIFFMVVLLVLIAAACIYYVYKWNNKENPEDRQKNKQMRRERSKMFIQYMNTSYNLGKLNQLNSVYTKELYRQEMATEAHLQKYGLRKVIQIQNTKGCFDNPFTNMYDGKVDAGNVHMNCDYICDYVHDASHTLAYSIREQNARISLDLLKSHYHRTEKEFTCPNCGNVMVMKGDYIVCEYCKTQFSADSANWILHGWNLSPNTKTTKNQNSKNAIYIIIVLLCMCLLPFVTIIAIPALLIFELYGLRQLYRVKQWEDIQKNDPGFSLNLMKTRIWNLIQTIGYAANEDPSKYQDLVTPEMANKMQKMHSQNILLDLFMTKCEPAKYWHIGNMEKVKFQCWISTVTLNGNRIAGTDKKIYVTLARPRKSVTPVLLEESFITCHGCGANLDVVDMRCPYCGNVSNITGWKVDNIEGM